MCALRSHVYTILFVQMCTHVQIPICTMLIYYKMSISQAHLPILVQPSTSHNPGLPASSVLLRLWIHCEYDLPAHPEADCRLQPISDGAAEATGFWKAGYPQGRLDAMVQVAMRLVSL